MNPVALITGASRGIGRGIALALARAGHDVVINFAANKAAAEATARDCRAAAEAAGHAIRVEPRRADISQAADRAALLAFTRERFGRLNLLVNNAGVAPNIRADLLETSEESFERLLRINVQGPFFLTQAAARWMIEQARTSPSGSPDETAPAPPERRFALVTISSISAYTASVHRAEYCVSKAALAMLTPLFAARLAEYGIRVYEIRPGVIATDMTGPVREKYDRLIAGGLTPLARWGQPEDVAQAVLAVAEGRFPFSTGEVFNVDGGFHLRRL